MNVPRAKLLLRTGLPVLSGMLVVLFLGHTLFSMWAAYTQLNFLWADYGIYTNALWNVAHGQGFTYAVDQSYLVVHLSFSLALIAPLFWILDHPGLLIGVQWLFWVGGLGFLGLTLRRMAVPRMWSWAALVWFAVHPYSVSVMLSEFHGVSAYFLLFPWLAYTWTSAKPAWSWLPLVLTLGLREDAGILVAPICLAWGWSQGRRLGLVQAGVSLGYSVLAILVMYPAFTGMSLLDVRARELTPAWTPDALRLRLDALIWLILPVIPLLRKKGNTALILLGFLLVPLGISMASGDIKQYSLGWHYPAACMASLAAGLPFVLSRTSMKDRVLPGAALMILLTVGTHAGRGFFLGGGRTDEVYTQTADRGRLLLELAREVPREGVLVTNQHLAVFLANRHHLQIWRNLDAEQDAVDLVVCSLQEVGKPATQFLEDGLRDGTWGVLHERFPYFVLQKGAEPSGNAGVLQMISRRRLSAAGMFSHRFDDRMSESGELIRHWPAEDSKFPQTVAFGLPRILSPGTWEIRFHYRMEPSPWPEHPLTGWLGVYRNGEDIPLHREEIRSGAGWQTQSLRIVLTEATPVEARVTGANAALWLRHIDFVEIRESDQGN